MEDPLFRKFSKYEKPILSPETKSKRFDSKAIYNPTVMLENGTVKMLYRAEALEDKYTGRIGLAYSKDGINFTKAERPVMCPENDYEIKGCEDPRLAKFGDTYYLTYVGNSSGLHGVCLATSKDLVNWDKRGKVLVPREGVWDSRQIKAGVIVPKKINGEYLMYFLGEQRPWETNIGLAYSEDLLSWEEHREPVLLPRKGHFDSQGVEPGATPVVIKEGILLIYNGWDSELVHKTGSVLFSKKDPTKVIRRVEEPILEPTKEWEKQGNVPNVVFSEGLIRFRDSWYLYYGATDKHIGLAISKEKGK